ncbi:signal transduction histidine kinase [Pullulanibacillus pueri]|uniref:sensor histidine kinase n=1 Tax=Pullulanibacillus pueri TaxID=1437324 RepID=UPI00166E8FB4|nr:ATP-binding protein [Pullulanibacillus pueri]MBM7683868.1 signal transduction histidine kinase [Pullulanibacillus pueri]
MGETVSNWSKQVSVALYRILQEGLSNVLRHSTATEVKVKVTEQDNQVTLWLSDNGEYDKERQLIPGFGIKGMITRSRELGETCEYSRNECGGLTVMAVLPADGGEKNGR